MAVLRLFIGHLHDPGQVTGQLERLGQWCGDQTDHGANICTLQVRRTSSGGLKANLST